MTVVETPAVPEASSFTQVLNAAISRNRWNREGPAPAWYPSNLGGCDRKGVFRRAGVKGTPFDIRTLRKFWLGDAIHQVLQKTLEEELTHPNGQPAPGWAHFQGVKFLGHELRVRDDKYNVSGRLDSLVMLKGNLEVFEFKSVASGSFQYGDYPKPEHLLQLGVYLTFPIECPHDFAKPGNVVELAWAGGFFDGEGHTGGKGTLGRPSIQVGQCGPKDRPPDVLVRFQAAVGGLGKIYGPYGPYRPNIKQESPLWNYQTNSASETREVLRLLWPWIGAVKREQATAVLSGYKKPAEELAECGLCGGSGWLATDRGRLIYVSKDDMLMAEYPVYATPELRSNVKETLRRLEEHYQLYLKDKTTPPVLPMVQALKKDPDTGRKVPFIYVKNVKKDGVVIHQKGDPKMEFDHRCAAAGRSSFKCEFFNVACVPADWGLTSAAEVTTGPDEGTEEA